MGSGIGESTGLVENGVLSCDASVMSSKVPESLDDALVVSVGVGMVLVFVGGVTVVVVVALLLGMYLPSESLPCLIFVNCASVPVFRSVPNSCAVRVVLCY